VQTSGTAARDANRDESPPREEEMQVDPDEPTYCLCDQISYGEMIMCDNDLCPYEWFHFSCVSLGVKPKGNRTLCTLYYPLHLNVRKLLNRAVNQKI